MKKANDWFKRIKKVLQPPRAFSWQTMIFLSAFSWFMALLALGLAALKDQPNSWVYNLIANFGWIFLIMGFHWWTVERRWFVSGFPIGAWFTGVLVCIYIFVWVFGDVTDKYPALPFVIWPLISAAISTLHKMNYARLNPKTLRLTTIQEIAVLILINLVFSCWLQFHFVVQGWLRDYPSLQADKFDRSAFVFKIDSPISEPARGYKILNAIAKLIQNKVNSQPWPEVEKWLAESNKQLQQKPWPAVRQWMLKLDRTQEAVKNQILADLEKKEEDSLWYIDAKLEERVADYYQLVLKAIWRGPTSRSQAYELTKTCQIEQAFGASPNPRDIPQLPTATGRMRCQRTIDPLKEGNANSLAAKGKSERKSSK